MSWIQHPAELIGNRVKLIPLEATHIDELCEKAKDPKIWEVAPFNSDKGAPELVRKDLESSVEKQHSGEQYNFTTILRSGNTIIGTTKFWMMNEPSKSLEIGGTWLMPEYWSTGINTECKYLLLQFCFETLQTVRVQIKANDNNLRSRRAIEKLGATFEGIQRKDKILLNGNTRNSALYSIIDTEWPVIKTRLQKTIATHAIPLS
jgi:RimJ/RimL family protein N-acetyltransferase